MRSTNVEINFLKEIISQTWTCTLDESPGIIMRELHPHLNFKNTLITISIPATSQLHFKLMIIQSQTYGRFYYQ